MLAALDDALLRTPAVAGHPGERGRWRGWQRDELPGVVAAHEEDHDSAWASAAARGSRCRRIADVGAAHLFRSGDADVALTSFLLEGLDPVSP